MSTTKPQTTPPTPEPTARPWWIDGEGLDSATICSKGPFSQKYGVCETFGYSYLSNAELIIKAVNNFDADAALLAKMADALQQIKKMKAEPVAPGFKQGPLVLFESCQRIARQALAAYEKAKPHA